MKSLQLKDKWVLVTGASSGLGKEMTTQLAKNYHANILIVARREANLIALKNELESNYKIQVQYLIADLSNEKDIENVFLKSKELSIYAVILNAGITYFGRDCLLDYAEANKIIHTNINAVVSLTQRFVRDFEAKNSEGGLMLVSSMAALYPAPYQAIYSGTKSFVFSYGHALSHELKNKNFSITVYAPGGIQTEMTAGESFSALQKWLMPVSEAAQSALSGFVKRKYTIIPGFMNLIGSKFMRLLPLKIIGKQMESMYRGSLDKNH